MLSRETRLGFGFLRVLTANDADWTPLSYIAAELDISRPYAAKVCLRLRDAGYVEGRPGPSGGIRPLHRARDATLLDIASDLDDPFVRAHCLLEREECDVAAPCPMHVHWEQVHERMLDALRACPLVTSAGPGPERRGTTREPPR